MAGNRSRAAALETPSANLFTGQFFNLFSVSSPRTMPFVAEYQSRPTASKAPSKNLFLGLSKILARRRKRLTEMASNLASEALRRENRKEPNLGSMERIGPDSNTLPNGTRMTVVSNGVGVFYAGSAVPEIRFLPVFIVRNFATYHVLLISVIVTILLGTSWHFSGQDTLKSQVSQAGWAIRAITLALTLILHYLSSSDISKLISDISPRDHSFSSSNEKYFPLSIFKKGSLASWALALLIILLIVMAQYQSNVRSPWVLV